MSTATEVAETFTTRPPEITGLGDRLSSTRATVTEFTALMKPAPAEVATNLGPVGEGLIAKYIQRALRRATLRQDEDGSWYAHVPVLAGAWADGGTAEEALQVLSDVLTDWVALKVADHDRDFPVLDHIDLNVL